MQPHDFLAAVLPSDGIYCVAELSTKKKEHRYLDTLDDVAAQAEKFNAENKDAYFALASFKAKGIRFAENAKYVKSLFVDIDCAGRAYKTKREGIEALERFLQETGLAVLGQPWLVDSGGGVHAYWPLEQDTPIEEWKPVAEAIKRLAQKKDFRIDMTVTADAARVLRVPGTTNYKYPKPVLLKMRGDKFALDAIKAVLGPELDAYKKATSAAIFASLPGTAPKREPNATQLKLIETSSTQFADIVGCLQIDHYKEHAKDDGLEPLWRAVLSITKYCDDGEEAAKTLSDLHPYDEQRMQTKLREIKGPYGCLKFDSENPGICHACPHWGKITNPLALGRKLVTTNKEKTIEIPAFELEEEPQTIQRPLAPKGFSYGERGGVVREKVEDSKTRQILVLTYDLFVVDVLHVDGVHTAHMVAMRPQGPQDIMLPLKAVVSKDETVKVLAQHNIIASFGSGNDKNLSDYVRACVEEASTRRIAAVIPTQYGWQKDRSFVFNSLVYLPDGSNRSTPMQGLENISKVTRPKGTLENWRSFVNMLIAKQLHDIIAHGCIGFGAPLMQYTGMRGLTFHAGHKLSGTGKSLALSMAASIWGHPVDYRTGKSTSPVAMQQRAGNLNSLPFLCDELTVKARADAEWFPSFVFDFSEGRGKERMESGANRERINTSTWSSLAFFTSNTRMLDFMTGVRQFSSEGELRRFLEWSPAQPLEFNAQEQKTIHTMHDNYGVAGEVYAKWLVQHQDIAARVVEKTTVNLAATYKTTNDERYWLAGCSAVVAGAILAGNKYAGVIDLPVQAIIKCFAERIESARSAIHSAHVTAEDILNDYTREFYGQMVVVRKSTGGFMASLGNGELLDQSTTRTKVAGRVEREITPGWTDYYIEEQLLKRHCSLYGVGYADFVAELAARFKVIICRRDMLANTRGPQLRVKALHISFREGQLDGLDGIGGDGQIRESGAGVQT